MDMGDGYNNNPALLWDGKYGIRSIKTRPWYFVAPSNGNNFQAKTYYGLTNWKRRIFMVAIRMKDRKWKSRRRRRQRKTGFLFKIWMTHIFAQLKCRNYIELRKKCDVFVASLSAKSIKTVPALYKSKVHEAWFRLPNCHLLTIQWLHDCRNYNELSFML